MGVSRLIKLVNDPEIHTWQYCTPVILSSWAARRWAARHDLCLAHAARRAAGLAAHCGAAPLIYLCCAAVAMAAVWLLLGLLPAAWRRPCREQLPIATCTCSVLGTLLLCAGQNYSLLQSTAFGLGSGLGVSLCRAGGG